MKIFNKDLFQIVPLKYSEMEIKYLEPLTGTRINSISEIKNWESIKHFLKILNPIVQTAPIVSSSEPIKTKKKKEK